MPAAPIGAGKAAKAAPDGYTFLVGHLGYMGAAPSIYKKLTYDPVKDFDAGVPLPGHAAGADGAARTSPAKTAGDLIDVRRRRTRTSCTSAMPVRARRSHLIAALFASKAGIKVMSVPYKGAARR